MAVSLHTAKPQYDVSLPLQVAETPGVYGLFGNTANFFRADGDLEPRDVQTLIFKGTKISFACV